MTRVLADISTNGTKVFTEVSTVATVVDNLTSTSATNALSANMGKVLNDALIAKGNWSDWTATFGGFTKGNATVVTRYTQIGKTVICKFSVKLGSTSAVTGEMSISFPVTGAAFAGTGNIQEIGQFEIFDTPNQIIYGYVGLSSTTAAVLRVGNVSGTYLTFSSTSSTVPMTWTTNDEFAGMFTYEAA